MFGARDNRTSYIKKPAAGFSRLRFSAAVSGRASAADSTKDVRPINAQQPFLQRKKTPEELFKEHKEAAIAWAAKRNLNESHSELPVPDPPTVPTEQVFTAPFPPRQPASTAKETFLAQSPVAFTISPPKSQTLTSPPIHKFTERKVSPNPVREPANAATPLDIERTRFPSPLPNHVNAPIKEEVDYGPFSPARAAARPPKPAAFSPHFPAALNAKPKESIFARFKKQAEADTEKLVISSLGSAPTVDEITPDSKADNSNNPAPPPPATAVNKTLYERTLDLIGVNALKQHERSFLFGLLISSPALIYVLEVAAQTYLFPGAGAGGEGLYGFYRVAQSEFSSMTPTDIGISLVLALLLSAVFDYNTRATDARIRHDWAAVVSFVASVRAQLLQLIGRSGAVHETEADHNASSPDASRTAKQRGVLTYVNAVLSVFTSIPVFARFVVTILAFGAASRAVLGRAVEAVGARAVQYGPALLVAAVLLLCAVAGFVYVRYALHRRAARSRAVRVLASVVKSLLQQRGRAYPILYLYEEVSEVVALSTSQRSALAVLSPTSTPAVVHGTPGRGYVGNAQNAAQTAAEPLLFGSPLGLSASSKQNLLDASVAEAGAVADGGTDAPASKVDALEGLKLAELWKEVQKAVEADRRIQRLELIVDGKKHACWRLLTGNTQANI